MATVSPPNDDTDGRADVGASPAPLFSVCVPAYNRAALLGPLLDSVFSQDFGDYEVVIAEDNSPERTAIRALAQQYQARYPGKLRYVENETNLGFDGNIRKLIASGVGRYCVFLGNDDLLQVGGLAALAGAIGRHPDVGVVLRSYATFDDTPDEIRQEFRYFPEERVFEAGVATAATFYRRSVVICGVTFHRECALRHSTDRHDGTLLYQLYIAAEVLFEMNGVSTPEIVALYRNGGVPDFGAAEAERGRFVPREQTVELSVEFIRGMLAIARAIDREHGQNFYRRTLADIANYSYPVLSIQARRPKRAFIRYWYALCGIGFWRFALFHAYFLALAVFGVDRTDALIAAIKRRLGYTPILGSISHGEVR